MATARINRSLKQLIAGLIVDADVPAGGSIYVIKAPIAGTERAKEARSNLSMYGVSFTEGVGIVAPGNVTGLTVKETDPENPKRITERPMTVLDLAQKIVAEFPDYTFEELK